MAAFTPSFLNPDAEDVIEAIDDKAESAPAPELARVEAAAGGGQESWWEAPAAPSPWADTPPAPVTEHASLDPFAVSTGSSADITADTGNAYFCGDTTFFSLNWALHTISNQKLTGTFRCFWNQEPVEILARDGRIILATTRDPELYCPEAPITLVNIDEDRVEHARQQQRDTGRPLFVSLAQEACAQRGWSATDRLAVVRQDRVATFLLKKTPFTAGEIAQLHAVADRLGFDVLYAPSREKGYGPFSEAHQSTTPAQDVFVDGAATGDYARLITAADREQFYSSYRSDIRPTTDDRPFFFHTTKIRDQFGVAFGQRMLFGNGLSA